MTKDPYKRMLCFDKKRGANCTIGPKIYRADGTFYYHASLCGCGNRTPPPIKCRRRIVRRRLKRDLEGLT